MLLAVNVDATAIPLELVMAVVVAVPLAKVPLAPLEGAVNVTTAPTTGFELPSVTVTCNGAKVELTAMLCGEPLEAMSVAAASPVPLKFSVKVPPL